MGAGVGAAPGTGPGSAPTAAVYSPVHHGQDPTQVKAGSMGVMQRFASDVQLGGVEGAQKGTGFWRSCKVTILTNDVTGNQT